jgi:class 3 adenylate cyclase/tetratricopeptide (TPR) repeat protein
VICSNCATENKPGRRFCAECGASLVVGCPSCGTPYEPGEKFCGTCGTALTAEAAAATAATPSTATPAPAAPATERRLVSVLFADLVGFTPFAEERDAEDVRATLDRYFAMASEVIGRYGGTVEKFIGDAVMAVWGTPTAHEDDAERAVRAALDLVDAVGTLGDGIQARAGILTGEAAVTIGATNQGLVAGDLVNTASRLQSVAQPGTVLVGEATQRAAGKAIAFEPAGEQALKGKASPVPAWRALRVVAQVGGRNRADALEAPFVGRDDELRLLKDLFHATTREGRARLVSVIGPAGIGKTRLAWEFLKYVDGLVETVWWHEGRSPAYGEGVTFWALGEMVRRRAGLIETDDEATTRAKIAAAVAEHVPDPDERRWIESALLTLLGVETGGGSDQLFGAWRTFFERLAATAPVVLVFEDYHYADPGLLDFVDHLLEWSRSVPIYVVTLSRPELLDKRPAWGAGKRNFVNVSLEPLPEPAMRALLAGLVPGLPERAVKAIVARADGIPLYAVETVRMLLAENRLVLEGNAYRPTGDLTGLAVPETLTALIGSRLDALAPADRALIQDAAAYGQSFTSAGLAAVSGTDEAELEPRLARLVHAELLTVTVDARSPERGQHAFVQALIREVAYHTLSKAARKARHLKAARYLESLGSDELAGALASHYLAASANASPGPEASALEAQARIALGAAAERAGALGAHAQAVTFLDQALSVTHDQTERAGLLERLGQSAEKAGEMARAEAALEEALAIRRAVDDRPGAVRTAALLASMLLTIHTSPTLVERIRGLATEFTDQAAEPAGVALLGQLARAMFLMRLELECLPVADEVLIAAERLDLVPVIADTLITKGSVLAGLGRSYEGLSLIETGVRLAEQRGLSRTGLRGRLNLGYFLAGHDPDAALAALRPALREARRLGDRGLIPNIIANIAGASYFSGRSLEVLPEIEAALAMDYEGAHRTWLLAEATWHRALLGIPVDEDLARIDADLRTVDDPQFVAFSHVVRAIAAWARGDEVTARAENLATVDQDAARSSLAYAMAGRHALLAGDLAAARQDRDALAARSPHAAYAARLHEIEGGIAALEGRPAEALELFARAIPVYEGLGLALDIAIAGLVMVTVMDPSEPRVRAAGLEARERFATIGAKPFVARVDEAMARSEPRAIAKTAALPTH